MIESSPSWANKGARALWVFLHTFAGFHMKVIKSLCHQLRSLPSTPLIFSTSTPRRKRNMMHFSIITLNDAHHQSSCWMRNKNETISGVARRSSAPSAWAANFSWLKDQQLHVRIINFDFPHLRRRLLFSVISFAFNWILHRVSDEISSVFNSWLNGLCDEGTLVVVLTAGARNYGDLLPTLS